MSELKLRTPRDTHETNCIELREGLFVSQGDHGVNAHGTTGRDVAGCDLQ